MSTERIKDLPDATLALTDRIPLESIADDVTRKTTPMALFSLLINNPATWAASASQAGILTNTDQSWKGNKTNLGSFTITMPHIDGTLETIFTAGLDEDTNAKFTLGNGSSANGVFIPMAIWASSAANPAGYSVFQGTSDSGAFAIGVTIGRLGANTAATVRPIHEWRNGPNIVLQMLPLNSGANAALSWGTQAVSGPAFTTRPAGVRMVLLSAIDASHVDWGFGVGSSSIYATLTNTNPINAFRIYAGITDVWNISGAGLMTTTGGKVRKVRVALTSPVTVAVTDDIVEVNLTVAGAVTINYPSSPTTGTEFVFQDGKGDAGANNHTHTPAAGNINGAATKVYATNYYRATAYYNGTQWLIG